MGNRFDLLSFSVSLPALLSLSKVSYNQNRDNKFVIKLISSPKKNTIAFGIVGQIRNYVTMYKGSEIVKQIFRTSKGGKITDFKRLRRHPSMLKSHHPVTHNTMQVFFFVSGICLGTAKNIDLTVLFLDDIIPNF